MFVVLLVVTGCGSFGAGSVVSDAGAEDGAADSGALPVDAGSRIVDVAIGTSAISAASTRTVVCVLLDGAVQCTGNNQFGQAGATSPVVTSATRLTAGYDHVCALSEAGQVWCWGYNVYGQLGPKGTNFSSQVANPQPVATYDGVTQVTAGYGHTCVIDSQQKAFCWGKRNDGELGTNDDSGGNSPNPAPVSDSLMLKVSAGNKATCLLSQAGAVTCSGANDVGQSGATASATPLRAFTNVMTNAVAISVGNGHACALDQNQRLYCWGRHANFGSSTADGPAPSPVGTARYTMMATGKHTCAIRDDQKIDCFGSNSGFQLGASDKNARSFEGITLNAPPLALAVADDTSCAVTANAELFCWGDVGFLTGGVSNTPTPAKVTVP